jgi:hypothetical protein
MIRATDMAFDLAQALRMKGMIDAVVREAPADPLTAAPALNEAYRNTRTVCLDLVTGTDVEQEFNALFPFIGPVAAPSTMGIDPIELAAKGDQARLLLAQLAGWLGSWPSADALLAELTTALEAAEAQTDEPDEKARLRNTLDGLRGAGRQIAIEVIAAYLARVPL